ncbi:hypothetical protein D1872_234230 [compost metagenome]
MLHLNGAPTVRGINAHVPIKRAGAFQTLCQTVPLSIQGSPSWSVADGKNFPLSVFSEAAILMSRCSRTDQLRKLLMLDTDDTWNMIGIIERGLDDHLLSRHRSQDRLEPAIPDEHAAAKLCRYRPLRHIHAVMQDRVSQGRGRP